MNWLPIIARELKAEARHPLNYWARLGAALILLLVLVGLGFPQGFGFGQGAMLFKHLNLVLLVSIWIIVPLLTGDCLSRERREGTLGLLFLTPLKPVGIVVGKGLAHALRGLTFVLVGFPILAIPVLLGGVNGHQMLQAMLSNGTALFLALSAGLIGSSFCREWNRALILSELLSASFALGVHYIRTLHLRASAATFAVTGQFGSYTFLTSPAPRFPAGVGGRLTVAQNSLVVESSLTCLALLTFLLAILFAAARLKNTWQEEPPSRAKLWLRDTFCTPFVWPSLFRRRMRRRLNSNPISWLEVYSWSARLGKWGWFLLITLIESYLIIKEPGLILSRVWTQPQIVLIHLLGLGLAFSAVGSFRREKLNGALELLLITPLREIQIIGGRLRGIWSQFLPSIILMGLIWLFVFQRYNFALNENIEKFAFPIKCVLIFVCVPVIGFYFSLKPLNFLFGWLISCLVGLLLPLVGRFLVGAFLASNSLAFVAELLRSARFYRMTYYNEGQILFVGLITEWSIQVACAAICFRLLWRTLKTRSFVLRPA